MSQRTSVASAITPVCGPCRRGTPRTLTSSAAARAARRSAAAGTRAPDSTRSPCARRPRTARTPRAPGGAGDRPTRALMIGKTLLTSSTPTWTWMPQIIMLRPHHWVRSMSLWYRVLSVTCWSYHCANGWLPAHSSSMPSGFADLTDCGDRIGDVVDGGRDRVADPARDLDRVGEQLAGHRVPLERSLLLDGSKHLGRARDEISRRPVGEHELPLEPHGGTGGCRERHRHSHSLPCGMPQPGAWQCRKRRRGGRRPVPMRAGSGRRRSGGPRRSGGRSVRGDTSM